MKTGQKLSPGDHLRVTLKRRGAQPVSGALVAEDPYLITLISSEDVGSPYAIIKRTDINVALVVVGAAQAVFDQSYQRLRPGMLISTAIDGKRQYGEVVAAWRGTAVARQRSGKYIMFSAADALCL